MPPRSQFESLPAEVLSYILTRCSREDLVNLAQTRSNMRAVCHRELINYPFTMRITSDNLKSWIAYFGEENTLLTRGTRSLDIEIAVTRQDLLDAFDDVDPTVFNVYVRPIHSDATRVFPLPSSLRKLSLELDWMPGRRESSDILLLLLRYLPERCPHLEELGIRAQPDHATDEFDICIRRLTRLKKLHLHVPNLLRIPNRLSLLPASLTDLKLWATSIQTQGDVAAAVTWVRGIRELAFSICAPRGIANVLMILSKGGATHLAELILREIRSETDPVTMMSLREALTLGLQEFSLLQPPLRRLSLADPSGWSDSLHLPLLHTAIASTITRLSFREVSTCIFPSRLPWPRLQSLKLIKICKMGYQGPLTEPIFPVLTAITMDKVDEIQVPEDLFPALEAIKWLGTPTPEQVASLVRHDIKRIYMASCYADDAFKPLWEAMGEHPIELLQLRGRFPKWIKRLARNGKRIFPEFPNIREFTISRG